MTPIETIESAQLTQRPAVKSGDTVRVHVKVREGDKERIQVFEGPSSALHRGGRRESITVRKMSYGEGVERIFPVHSPGIDKIEVVPREGTPRQALLPARPPWQSRPHEGSDAQGHAEGLMAAARTRPTARRNLENALRRAGHHCVAGVDEVGRGCLAGPVTAAAVVLDPERPIVGLRGLQAAHSPDARARLHDLILDRGDRLGASRPGRWPTSTALNIHKASLAAMRRTQCWDCTPQPRLRPRGRLCHPRPPGTPPGTREGRSAVRLHCRRLHRGQGDP